MVPALYAQADTFIFAIYLVTLSNSIEWTLGWGDISRAKGVKRFMLFSLQTFPKTKKLDAEAPWFPISSTQRRYASKHYKIASFSLIPKCSNLQELFHGAYSSASILHII